MIQILKQLFGFGPKADLNELRSKGAVVVDVRTKQEYASGHVKGSLNIPLDALQKRMKELPANRPIITCCASGMRSGSARRILLSNGFKDVYNGGSWASL